MADSKVLEAAQAELKDATKFVFFDEQGNVLASNFTVDASELKPLTALFGERDDAIKHGITLQGVRYEVHRHHPPLVYGRTMGGVPENSEGAAVCKVEGGRGGQPCYGAITYAMPNISARMVPMLQKFCDGHLAASS